MINHHDSSKMKNMKRILLLIIVFSIQSINAQDRNLQRANRFFEKTSYSEAIPRYEKIVTYNNADTVIKNLAECYYYIANFDKAQHYYSLLFDRSNKDLDEADYFKYSQVLKGLGKYEAANKLINDYLVSNKDSDALAKFNKEAKILENVSAIGNRFEIKNLAFNTEKSEFGAVKLGDKLVFSAVRKNIPLFGKTFKWNNESYLNLVTIAIKNQNAADSAANFFSKKINTPVHEANAIFTKDGKTMYFTRNNFTNWGKAKNDKKVSTLLIFRSELVDDKWTKAVALPFNSEDYSVEHPALSVDEKTLYFASDMPGTLGSFDLYSVSINGKTFGTPKNLGTTINTPKKEQFPFIAEDGKLYFSSDGHEGYGSLDVFVSEFENNDFKKPQNVGLPLNSGYDDFAFTIDSKTKEGYFSSNRKGGKGSDDIYQLKETLPLLIENCKQYIVGVITDFDSKKPLDNALVVLKNDKDEEIQRFVTAADGKFNLLSPCDTNYTIHASKEEFTNKSMTLRIDNIRDKENDASMILRALEIIKNEELVALEQKEKEAKLAQEAKDKAALVVLEKKKKEDEIALLQQKKDKVLADKREVEKAIIQKKEKLEALVSKEKDVVKVKDRMVIKTDPIYFDYNLWYIRRDSKVILNRVIELMKKYPEMVIEIGSHTDNRGNANYNMNLSEQRANATKEYFIDQGIADKRVIAKGYGETVQIVKCEPSDSCTEEQHELNRRSEFVILNL